MRIVVLLKFLRSVKIILHMKLKIENSWKYSQRNACMTLCRVVENWSYKALENGIIGVCIVFMGMIKRDIYNFWYGQPMRRLKNEQRAMLISQEMWF